jgi:hypothetical protein
VKQKKHKTSALPPAMPSVCYIKDISSPLAVSTAAVLKDYSIHFFHYSYAL